MRANCELTLPRGRQIIISGIGLGLRFFYLMNFFTQGDPPSLHLGLNRRWEPSDSWMAAI